MKNKYQYTAASRTRAEAAQEVLTELDRRDVILRGLLDRAIAEGDIPSPQSISDAVGGVPLRDWLISTFELSRPAYAEGAD